MTCSRLENKELISSKDTRVLLRKSAYACSGAPNFLSSGHCKPISPGIKQTKLEARHQASYVSRPLYRRDRSSDTNRIWGRVAPEPIKKFLEGNHCFRRE